MFFNILMISFVLFEPINTEYFSSMAQLRQAVEYVRKSETTKYIEHFIQEQRSNLEYVRKVHRDLTKLKDISENIFEHGEHPLSAFSSLEIIADAQLHGNKNLSARTDVPFNKSQILEYMSWFPTLGDLEGSAVGIITIQEIHKLRFEDIANGVLKNHRTKGLTAHELIDIAMAATSTNLWNLNNKFMYTTVRGLKILKVARMKASPSDAIDIYTAFVDLVGRINCTCTEYYHKVIQRLLELNPALKIANECAGIELNPCAQIKMMPKKHFEQLHFEALCRGETVPVSPDIVLHKPLDKLACRNVHNNDPRLILAPEKVEELSNFNPQISIIHDLITERDVKFFIAEATNRLKRGSTILKQGRVKDYLKVSQQYILPKRHKQGAMKHLRERLSALTSLSLRSFENIMVVNYACGGLYTLHVDVVTPSLARNYTHGMRNRMVTIVVYLKDVSEGGETVFPSIGIRVTPKKFSALMFYNMYRNGNINYLVGHSSCPVVHGEKWIANQWIVNHGQEFHYPCLLDKHL